MRREVHAADLDSNRQFRRELLHAAKQWKFPQQQQQLWFRLVVINERSADIRHEDSSETGGVVCDASKAVGCIF